MSDVLSFSVDVCWTDDHNDPAKNKQTLEESAHHARERPPPEDQMWNTANIQMLGVADQGFHAPPQIIPPPFRENKILDQQLRRTVEQKK